MSNSEERLQAFAFLANWKPAGEFCEKDQKNASGKLREVTVEECKEAGRKYAAALAALA